MRGAAVIVGAETLLAASPMTSMNLSRAAARMKSESISVRSLSFPPRQPVGRIWRQQQAENHNDRKDALPFHGAYYPAPQPSGLEPAVHRRPAPVSHSLGTTATLEFDHRQKQKPRPCSTGPGRVVCLSGGGFPLVRGHPCDAPKTLGRCPPRRPPPQQNWVYLLPLDHLLCERIRRRQDPTRPAR